MVSKTHGAHCVRWILAGGLVCAILAGCLHGPLPASGKTFFVAAGGDDANPGTRREPFKSLEAVRDAIRALRQEDGLDQPVTVYVRGGVYPRDRAFKLSEEDSGTLHNPVVYRAYRNESVILSGGTRVDPSWCVPVAAPAILARLDQDARGHVLQVNLRAHGLTDYGEMSILAPMLEVFFDGKRLPLARWPNCGWTHIGQVVTTDDKRNRQLSDGNKRGQAFQFEGDRPLRWLNAKDLVLHGFWWFGWSDEHVPVKKIDPRRREITLERVPSGGIRQDQWYCALNLLEEIDRPGEWYLDRDAGTLYFWPPDKWKQGRMVVSTLAEPLLVLEGGSDTTVCGMTLEVTRGVGIVFGGGARNRLAGCIVRGIGSDAIVMDHGKDNAVVGCDIHDAGATGIHLRGGNRGTLEPSGHQVVNCHIFRYAQRKKVYRPAVRMYGVGHRFAHNLIHDAPHQAIAYDGNDHIIEFNEIHHVVLESADAGVMYTGCNWTFRGNEVRYNFIHHIPHGPGLGTVGVYLDDCASSTRIFGNVFYDVLKPTFIGGGRDNVIANNIFVQCDVPVYLDNRGLRWDHFRPDGPMYEDLKKVPYTEPPWSTRYPELARILDECPQAPLGNEAVRNVSVRSTWRDPEKHCRETSDSHIETEYIRLENNFITEQDPGFVDAEKMNFKLRQSSIVYDEIPAFEPIPFDRIGLYKDEFRATWPVEHRPMRGTQ